MISKLSDICSFVKGKVDVSSLSTTNYISTENMNPNKGGICEAAGFPTLIQTQSYQRGDVLVSNIRPYFKKIWQANCDGGCSNDVLVFRANEGISANFLYYVLADDNFFNYSMLTSKGTKMPRGDKIAVMQYAVPDFEISIQRKVASVLRILDEQIEQNNAINENLEQQIQNIFHNIFPDIFKGSLDTLESIILFSNGKKRPEEIGTVPVYGGNGILTYTRDSNSENCVIIGRVGAYCGNTYLCSGKCWVSDNAIQAKSKNSNSQLFIYYCLKNASLPLKHIGSGQPLMTQGILNSIQCVIPDEIEVEQFIIHCTSMQQCIDSNIEENDRLSKLRDTLLPKLMSGEIDVSNVTI